MDIAETIKYHDICAMLERIKKATLPSKEKYLRRYYESFLKHREAFRREKSIEKTAEETGDTSFYCVLRCLIPGADTARVPYNMQITSLGKIYIKVLQLPQDSREVQRLNARSYSGIQGDYADVVFSVLSPRVQKDPSNLTLKEIHDMLDTIAADDRRNTEKVLTALVEKSSAQEQKWFIRLLLKSMHLGIGEQRVLGLLHPQAKELYQRCSNLLRVCCLLADNKLTLTSENSVGNGASTSAAAYLNLNAAIVPFQHIRPMLCEVFPGDIGPLMAADVLYMETKMDGERFQLHYIDGCFKYLSRNGKDYTANFGDSYNAGNLTPHLRGLLPVGLHSIIIDGEMMVWDERQNQFRHKGENTDVKHLSSSGDSTWRPCFVAYDLLYLDGTSMLDIPYAKRIHKLKCLLTEKLGVLQIMKPLKVTSLEMFKDLFQKALDDNQEGVVVKKQNSIYRPGVRNGGGWYKVKADYIDGLTQEFDLLIMGGFYNRQRTWIESFLVGVLSYTADTGKFDVYSVGTVTNLTRQRSVFNDRLKPHWQDLATNPAPLWYHYKERNPEGCPDVWIDPRNSIILQIRAADLTNSTAHALPKCLHFPRIVRQREDKDWLECLTLNEFRALYQGTGRELKKINRRELNVDDFTTHRKKHKLTVVDKRKLGMLSYEKKFNPEEIERTSDIFAGYMICILSASLREGITPEELQTMVISHGGEIVQNPIYTNPKCISIAGDKTYRVERMCKVRRTDIVHFNWLLRCCKSGELQSLIPRDMICITEPLQAKFAETFDKYGDSFEDCVNLDELKEILDDITDEQLAACEFSEKDIAELEAELGMTKFFRCSSPCSYFFNPNSSQRLELAKLLYEYHGGQSLESACDFDRVSYIFIDTTALDKREFKTWLEAHFSAYLSKLQVVNIDWIIHSHQADQKLDVCEYSWLDF